MSTPRSERGWTRRFRDQAGQVEVETAVVLPMVVFLLLGLLQMGLIQQARMFAEYAAYKAVRTGALNNMDRTKMERAAVAAALPVLSWGNSGTEVMGKTHSATDWTKKYLRLGLMNRMLDYPGLKYAEMRICGPTKEKVQSLTYQDDSGNSVVPFDNPQVAGRGGEPTKLRTELTLNYRLVIPFADYVIHNMWLGKKVTADNVLRLDSQQFAVGSFNKYRIAATAAKIYVIPIRAQYTMKLMSDVNVDLFPDENECVVQ
jgi:hypothetical protein